MDYDAMNAVVYIIPGFGERTTSTTYRNVAMSFAKQKIRPVFISIQWKYKTMTDYVNQFVKQVHDPNQESYLFGFSFGAMIAMLATPRLKTRKLFLCSLSPFFKEDLPGLSIASRASIGAKRLIDFSSYSFYAIAQKIDCQTFLFVGENELPSVINRAKIAHEKIKDSRFKIITECDHDIHHPNYEREILSAIHTSLPSRDD